MSDLLKAIQKLLDDSSIIKHESPKVYVLSERDFEEAKKLNLIEWINGKPWFQGKPAVINKRYVAHNVDVKEVERRLNNEIPVLSRT